MSHRTEPRGPRGSSTTYYVRYANPDDPAFGVVKLLLPNGGVLTALPDHGDVWLNEGLKELAFGTLIKLDDVEVSRAEYERLTRFALAMLQITFEGYASTVTELLLMDL